MKTSTLLISLLVLNSSVLFAQFANWLFAAVNPLFMIGSEVVLVAGYFTHQIIKDVRDAFDVDVKL